MPLNKLDVCFRIVALIEGLSYILLLFVAVPIKYFFYDEQFVRLLGMPHGILFITYILLALIIYIKKPWHRKDLLIIVLASIVPFGTFYIDWKYLKN